MTLAELIAKLRTDLGKTEAELGDATAKRMIEKAIVRVNKDMGTSYAISGAEGSESIDPEPSERDEELILVYAAFCWSGIQRNLSTAKAFSWRSGDKQVNRISMAENWKGIQDGLYAMYRELTGLDDVDVVESLIAEIQTSPDAGIGTEYGSYGGDE